MTRTCSRSCLRGWQKKWKESPVRNRNAYVRSMQGHSMCPWTRRLFARQRRKNWGVVDGDRGLSKGSTMRALGGLSLGFWLLRQDLVPRKALQVLLGREVHTMQFQRPLFGSFDYLWRDVSDGGAMTELGVTPVEEVVPASTPDGSHGQTRCSGDSI